jgi:hypothetical protein
MNSKAWAAALATLAMASTSHADSFINGGFENGDTSGWTVGNGNRSGAALGSINPTAYLNGNTGRSAIIGTAGIDPHLGAALGSLVYSGNYSYRVEDTTFGGLLSVVSQTVTNYTDANIFFAWKGVLEGAHGPTDSAAMIITLKDLTAGDTVISRNYNAGTGGGGVDVTKFQFLNNYYYTPQWQIEQLAIDASRSGHSFELTVLATDCGPTGHAGYVYLDGFGAVTPPTGDVPEPGTIALVGAALLGMAGVRRRKQA